MNKILEKLQDVYDFVFNDTVVTIGEFVACLYCIVASLYFVISGIADAILPRLGWVAVFGFMLVAGTRATENLVNIGVEDIEDEDEEEDEDGEIVN